MASIATPTSIDEVEALVLALYDPASVSNVTQIQAALHQVQKSPEGWRLAHELLGRQDEKVRFFGVLTFIIKLNTESDALNPNDATELRDTLLQWLVTYSTENSSKLVLQKLSTALVTFYLRFPKSWDHAVRHVLNALSVNTASPLTAVITDIAPSLHAISVALLFSTDLAEEACKMDPNSTSNIDLFDSLQENIEDVCALILHGIRSHMENPSQNHNVAEASIHCLQAWVSLSQKFLAKATENSTSFKSLILTVIEMMTTTRIHYPAGTELLIDLLSYNVSLLTPQHFDAIYSLLFGPIGQMYYSRLLGGDFDFECLQYGLIAIALADSQVSSLITTAGPREERLLEMLSGFVTTQGYPAVEDKLFVPAMELWCNMAEALADECLSTDDPNAGLKYLAKVSQTVYSKIALPPPDELADWDSSEKDSFSSARRDVADFLEAAHSSLGDDLLSYYGRLMLEKLSLSSWKDLESVAYCLGAFTYCFSRNESTDSIILPIFSQDLFTLLHPSNTQMPARCRQTCIGLIEKFSSFFQRNVDRLPSALTVLFSVIGDSGLTAPATKSIYELCTSCKDVLMPEAPGFIAQYRTMMSGNVIDCITREKLAGAIASVIQAVQDEGTQLNYLSQMLDVIEQDVKLSLDLLSNPTLWQVLNVTGCSTRCCSNIEPSELGSHVAIRSLRCLLCVAKDIRSTVDYTNIDAPATAVSERMLVVQSRLMQTIDGVQSSFPTDSEIVDVICHILRTGISESAPGPFVFPVEQITRYLTSQSLQTPRIAALIATACSLASSLSRKQVNNSAAILTDLTNWVIGLVRQLPDIDSDTELAQNALYFAEIAVKTPENTLLLLQSQSGESLETIFGFSLKVLDGKEPLSKSATLDFWTTFLGHPIPLDLDDPYRKAMDELGPSISAALMRNVGGNASRSELDKLSSPIKKMVMTKPQAKGWLENALLDPSFPSTKVSDAEKSQFVKKLIVARGSRNTNQIIRDFWLACRGTQFAYVS
ncbi:hypothetical protein TD95_001601 [Thielaviopsis punctulata]|uniref:Exportin-1/Importin-beta-like domain-containing protein n=1 Tax=Thielaviopsis punctulata TaxID=72032 RepID=A0A0F4ZGZ3_9PEZI|nr:hypothetical protein TD95_001601 [Thielaviopsis punctulata]